MISRYRYIIWTDDIFMSWLLVGTGTTYIHDAVQTQVRVKTVTGYIQVKRLGDRHH